MSSTPSPDTPRPKWMNGIHWNTSNPFRVEWQSKGAVPFRLIGHLKNSLNEGQAVLVGKDGQEVEEECGRQLVSALLELGGGENEKDDYNHHHGDHHPNQPFHHARRLPPTGPSGSSGPGRAPLPPPAPSFNGGKRPKFVKREEPFGEKPARD